MSVHPPHSLFLSRACIEAVEINGMCHPSLSALRARFHNIQCSWEVFPARLFPPTSGTGVFSLSLYTVLLILEQEIFFSLVASVPIFLFFPTLSVLSFFCLILHIVSRVPGTHLFVFVSLQSQYPVFLR